MSPAARSIAAIVPAFNAERFITDALDSIKKQVRQPEEVVVVDDGSTDGTASLVQDWSATHRPDLKFIRQENRGAAAARNAAILSTKCDLVAPVDADDVMLPNHLELLSLGFDAIRELVVCFGDATTYDKSTLDRDSYISGSRLLQMPFEEGPHGLRVVCGSAYGGLVGAHRIATPASLLSRSHAIQAGLYNMHLAQAEDVGLLLKMSRLGSFAYFRTAVARVRRHDANLSHRRNRILSRQCKVQLYSTLLKEASQMSLSDEEQALTRQALKRAIRSLLYNASQTGIGCYLEQRRWIHATGQSRGDLAPWDLIRAIKNSVCCW